MSSTSSPPILDDNNPGQAAAFDADSSSLNLDHLVLGQRSQSLAPSSLSSSTTPPPLRSASVSTLPSVNSVRRLSRKLPPALTESLENLAQSNSPSPSSSSYLVSQRNPLDAGIDTHHSCEGVSPLTKTIGLPADANEAQQQQLQQQQGHQFILSVAEPISSGLLLAPLSTRSNSGSGSSTFSQNIFYTPNPNLKSDSKPPQKRSIKKGSISGPSSTSTSQLSLRPNMFSRKGSSSSSSNGSTSTQLQTPPPSHASRFLTTRGSVSSSSASCGIGRDGSDNCGTWSIMDEVEMSETIAGKKNKKESRTEKKLREKKEKERFDERRPPTAKELFEASLLQVVGEHGERVKFGDLVNGKKRTIVVFIRHWFCPLCAQYMNSIISEVSVDALEKANVELLIIGNGSDKMLDGYRNKAFRCPFKMYTDPTLALYRALGLTRQTGDSGPEEEKGDYLVQSAMESTVQTIKRATKMPLRNPGHFLQLGGEFVFDSPLNVIYTHRMTNTRSHSPIRDICAEAGVRLEFIHYEPGPPPPPVHRSSYLSNGTGEGAEGGELDNWQKERDDTLSRMRALKVARREGVKAVALDGYTFDKRSKVDNVKIVDEDVVLEEEEVEVEGLGFVV
ncbi:hypothetical protein IAR55_001438 [Kwoniella newhampshirensis]|uniref:Thioredoxin domain-containing protein n=1 Tax=Kwoniella newhampshirensis TaxID=1651941 RepID=A0AAW0Z252_9TREE